MVNRIFFFRHLPTVSDDDPASGTLLSGPELDAEPLSSRAEEVGNWIRGQISGRCISVIRRDDSVRCVLTAARIAHAVSCYDIRSAEMALHPRRWGALTGKRWADVEPILSSMNMSQRRKYRPDGGESWMDVEGRLRRPLLSCISSGEGNIAFVSHHSIVRVGAGILVGPKAATEVSVRPGGFVELVRAEHRGDWKIHRIENPPE
jgi:broad specificity phosphatase PhoE